MRGWDSRSPIEAAHALREYRLLCEQQTLSVGLITISLFF